MAERTPIDSTYSRTGPGPLRYAPVIDWCLAQGCALAPGRTRGVSFAGRGQADSSDCILEGPVRLEDVLERFALPDGVVLGDEGFWDRRENVRMAFRAPAEPDADLLARHGEASLGDRAADAALASFLRFREAVADDLRDTDMRFTEAVSARIYEKVAGSDAALRLDQALQRLGATPASRLGALAHFRARSGEDAAEGAR